MWLIVLVDRAANQASAVIEAQAYIANQVRRYAISNPQSVNPLMTHAFRTFA